MAGVNQDLTFTPISIAVLTVSDTRTPQTDTSGDLLAERIDAAGHKLGGRVIVKDDKAAITAQVKAWINDPDIDAIISTGGTGLTGRDPGSNGAVKDGWDKVISFQLDSRYRPCNMVELIPRLSER